MFTGQLSFLSSNFSKFHLTSSWVINRVSDDLKTGCPAELAAKAITGDDDAKRNTLLGIVISNASLRAPLSSEQPQFIWERIPIWLQKGSTRLRFRGLTRIDQRTAPRGPCGIKAWDERYLERAESLRVSSPLPSRWVSWHSHLWMRHVHPPLLAFCYSGLHECLLNRCKGNVACNFITKTPAVDPSELPPPDTFFNLYFSLRPVYKTRIWTKKLRAWTCKGVTPLWAHTHRGERAGGSVKKILLEGEWRGGWTDRQMDGYHMLISLLLESARLYEFGLLEKPGAASKPDTHADWRCVRSVRRGVVVQGC